ncbi:MULTISPECIES: post-transcriptional regulator [Thalassobacillus]|uniref:post-transcriptional regulator n=1 Tax=Thalassobacillus TaxID=331971 RepID=UPI000A1CC4F7|nr:post-transcriptional regulator [Thalassobacillus devorans]
MKTIKSADQWKLEVYPALRSKAEEFRLMGYPDSIPDDIWNCLISKVWKGNPDKHLYEMVQDIFHLNTALYISFLTVEAHRGKDLVNSIAEISGEKESASSVE